MSDCCSPEGYRWIFSKRAARADARRYRKRGLDAVSGSIVALLRRRGVQDRDVLEVGGGVGGVGIELLRAGVRRVVNVELTPTYEEVALDLLREAGFEAQVERRLMDFAEAGADVPAADVVVLNRVICCYPDMPRLAGAAAEHAREVLVLTFPNGRWWTRVALAAVNLVLRALRRRFHVFTHPPAQIAAVVERHGLRTVRDRRGPFWQLVVFERAA